MKKLLEGMVCFLSLGNMANIVAQEPPAIATFAGGCFWCMEPPFDKLDGVLSTTSGYTDGQKKNPSYKEVSAGGTGHTEAIQIEYDPSKISYEELLSVFWKTSTPPPKMHSFVIMAVNIGAASTITMKHNKKPRRPR